MGEIVNAVGGGTLSQEIDLATLQSSLDGHEISYEPEHWPGLYARFQPEDPAVLIFRTGKYNIAGADSVDELFAANDEFRKRLQDLGFSLIKTEFNLRNVVMKENYGRELDLNQVAILFGLENTEYEPEQFSGLVIQHPDFEGTVLMFRTGETIITGSTSVEMAEDGLTCAFSKLDDSINSGVSSP